MPFPPPPLGTPMLPAGTFDGTTVLITGGGTGLGRAMAVEFARLGARVGVLSRKAEHRAAGVAAVTGAARQAGWSGTRAVGAKANVRDPEAVAAAFDVIEAELGPVRVLVNNAAANFPVLAGELSPNGWRAVVDTVLTGSFLCSRELHHRHVARELLEPGVVPAPGPGIAPAPAQGTAQGTSPAPAAILNILAAQAATGGPGMVHSASAKAGVEAMTKTLAVEWAQDGIRVNGLVPGLFPHEDLPEALRRLREADPDHAAVDARRQPAGRVGQPHELGWAATYLCSPFAGFLTGHTLVLDGGNQLRRDFVMPPVVPLAEQLGGLP